MSEYLHFEKPFLDQLAAPGWTVIDQGRSQPAGNPLRELGHRWASCSPSGNLAFHWKCMMAPQTIIDYIVVHELCHFHHLDHADAFWNEFDKVLPSYGERMEWLRKNGAGLDV